MPVLDSKNSENRQDARGGTQSDTGFWNSVNQLIAQSPMGALEAEPTAADPPQETMSLLAGKRRASRKLRRRDPRVSCTTSV